MEVVSGTVFKLQESIRCKLVTAGAISQEKAITVEEAHFDMQEVNWLSYLAGGMFARVKKTTDKRYYASNDGYW
jgi:hypothetical protein